MITARVCQRCHQNTACLSDLYRLYIAFHPAQLIMDVIAAFRVAVALQQCLQD